MLELFTGLVLYLIKSVVSDMSLKNLPYLQGIIDYIQQNSDNVDRSLILMFNIFMLDYRRTRIRTMVWKAIATEEYKNIPPEIRRYIFLCTCWCRLWACPYQTGNFIQNCLNIAVFHDTYEEVLEMNILTIPDTFYITAKLALWFEKIWLGKNLIDKFKTNFLLHRKIINIFILLQIIISAQRV